MEREKFSSRLGFILISAGCAIGLGNVWRFPYITGKYGGGAFVLIYLFFLVVLGLPIIISEFAVGRGSRKSTALSFEVLEPAGSKWHVFKWVAMAGNYLLMMFYTTISGWMLLYFFKMIRGDFTGLSSAAVTQTFSDLTGKPALTVGFMCLIIVGCFAICGAGLQKGVERIVKVMMVFLLVLMAALAIHSLFLPGAKEGLAFYLKPDFHKMAEAGIAECVFAAMGQAFFTLSIGMGSMAIFGSYIDKSKRLTGEALNIAVLDTLVALLAGIIIFPACFSFGIEPQAGPPLIFITLPNVFNAMSGGRIWGLFFFLFMSFAAISTVVAVFQNIVSYATDLTGCSIKKACVINAGAVILLSLPCALGFNLLSGVQPLGAGSTILDLEDFIISNNIMPLGSLVYLFFCVTKWGWGWDNFIAEVNAGTGIRFPKGARFYLTYILPLIVLAVFLGGYLMK
ncbi:MAG: sodium-dependent transporter [Eubacteriaceae bacterium]|nr:sodium-dependent transporter [Eubacteriaceae bacterium]